MATKTFKITTLGCKVNQYESAYLNEAFARAGLRPVPDGEKADIEIVNTCIVTQKAAHQSRQAIRKAIRENPDGRVAAIGCYAQAFPEKLREIDKLSLIAGNSVKSQIPELILNMPSGARPTRVVAPAFDKNRPFDFLPVKGLLDRSRAFLKIQDGCESHCSYCIVPLTRGPCRSLPVYDVLFMLKGMVEQGYKEVVLTGIHLGKYGIDLKNNMNLRRLLEKISKENFPLRIRLSSLEPNEINSGIIDIMASEKWLCKHFHIPLQSGDNDILKRMNRRYTVAEFIRLIENIHGKIPLAAIGIDVMAGFPKESPESHQNTLALIHGLPVSYLHVFPFSARPGTPAFKLKNQTAPQVIKERAAQLRTLGREKRNRFYTQCLNKNFVILAEGWYSLENRIIKGTSDNYVPVIFNSLDNCKGRLIPVLLERVEKDRVFGIVA